MYGSGKSDSSIVPEKLPNNARNRGAEVMEERGLTKGNSVNKTESGHSARELCRMWLTEYGRW
jgi:hypothetical protein